MNVGIPGTGVGGLFFVLCAILALPVELVRTVRGQSSPERRKQALHQALIAVGMIGALAAGYALLRGVLLVASSSPGRGSRAATQAHDGLPNLMPVASVLLAAAVLAAVLLAAAAAHLLVGHPERAASRWIRLRRIAPSPPAPVHLRPASTRRGIRYRLLTYSLFANRTDLSSPLPPRIERDVDAPQRPASNGAADATAPDLPPELEAEDLPGALFGYDRYTIVKLLDRLRERFQELWQERAELKERLGELELELHRSHEGQRLIGETLVRARQEAQTIEEDARRSAQELLRRVRKQADRTLEQARLDAEATARELLESAEQERRKRQQEAARAKAFVDQTHEQLSDFLLAAVKWYEEAKLSDDAEAGDQSEARPAGDETG